LKGLPEQKGGFLITSWDKGEDAATWMIDDKRVAIFTLDFITPVVDDPFTYGQIAAANALSDVFAMGGRPLVALNIVGFPVTCEPLEVLSQILKGGQERVNAAGAVLAGGHSVDDGEPKYGLAVFGEVDAAKMWKVTGARPGDSLILTKPLGTGLIATAIKAEMAGPEEAKAAVESMRILNDLPTRLPGELLAEVHACTDVTGFSLAGHLLDMLAGGLEARLLPEALPLLPGALEKAQMGLIPGGSNRNMELYAPRVVGLENISGHLPTLLFDAQTSGGLLLAVSEVAADRFLEACHDAGFPHAARVGSFIEGPERIIL
jgi:selenide,water dikinase